MSEVVAGYPGTENAPAEELHRITKTVLKHTDGHDIQ